MSASMLQRFQGSLVGGVVGDCIGAVYEGLWGALIGTEKILKLINKIEAVSDKEGDGDSEQAKDAKRSKRIWTFTDDTAMARSVTKSLIQNNGLDVKDMAVKFTEEYFKESYRGYGGGVISVFRQLAECDCLDVFGPAKRQFDGQGSYGNGGSMRIGPAGLFAYKKSLDFDKLKDITEKITMITHTHTGAVHGAILQCCAVHQALSTQQLDVDTYIDGLIKSMKQVEKVAQKQTVAEKEEKVSEKEGKVEEKVAEPTADDKETDTTDSDEVVADENMNYCDKLEKIREFVKQDTLPSNKEVQRVLGTDISAFRSAPTAVYCFLAATRDIPGIEGRNPFEKTIIYAISLGGDTDTIATMAGAIAGAYYGLEMIPSSWYKRCEGSEDALKDAENLYNLT